MGQYHKLYNLDKKEFVDPYALGLGSKQFEHTGCKASLSDAMYLLVMTSPQSGGGDWLGTPLSGRWVGDRVVVVGDYTQADAIPGYAEADKIYASKEFKDISTDVATALGLIWDIKFRVTSQGFIERGTLSEEDRAELMALL